MAMLILFASHVGKDLRGVRMFFSQFFCEIGISPPIFFLAADGQRKNLRFRKLIERFHVLTLILLDLLVQNGECQIVGAAVLSRTFPIMDKIAQDTGSTEPR